MRLLLVLLTACAHTPRPYGLPYGSVYCSHACMPAPSAFLAALAHAEITATLADCCKEAR